MHIFHAALVASATFFRLSSCSYVSTLPINAQGLFNESMNWMDDYYDPAAGYLYEVGGASALRHETRSSAWYAIGLLGRNGPGDVKEAERIITNVIHGQYKNPEEQWYAEYQQEPEEPYVGSTAYPAEIYGTWDANWRGFIGTTFIIGIEEFAHLLSNKTTNLMLESLKNATIGDSYRVGGLDDDNLYPAYSNPSIMRAFVSGWTGRRIGDKNFTTAGEDYAQEIVDLFNRANTLSEFNSGTYTGVSLFGLTLWAKYIPEGSVMNEYGIKMLKTTWESVAQLWHPQMKNMAGPWDRAYGFDMNKYVSLMALWLWVVIGKEKCSLISKPQVMSHNADFEYAPLFAILADFHVSLIPANVTAALNNFIGEHTFTASTYSPPFDYAPRNITAWLAPNITIGAEAFDENVIGGPAENQDAFNPAVVQWDTGNGIGFISLYATEPALTAVASPGRLDLSYPYGNSSSIFTFIVSTFERNRTIADWSGVQGLSVNVSGNTNPSYALSFAGEYGGADSTIRDFEFWNFTYSMPENFTGIPRVVLDLDLW